MAVFVHQFIFDLFTVIKAHDFLDGIDKVVASGVGFRQVFELCGIVSFSENHGRIMIVRFINIFISGLLSAVFEDRFAFADLDLL